MARTKNKENLVQARARHYLIIRKPKLASNGSGKANKAAKAVSKPTTTRVLRSATRNDASSATLTAANTEETPTETDPAESTPTESDGDESPTTQTSTAGPTTGGRNNCRANRGEGPPGEELLPRWGWVRVNDISKTEGPKVTSDRERIRRSTLSKRASKAWDNLHGKGHYKAGGRKVARHNFLYAMREREGKPHKNGTEIGFLDCCDGYCLEPRVRTLE